MNDWHYRLALQRELETAEEELTGWLLEDLDNWKNSIGTGPENKSSELTIHPFTELLAVADENESVEVILSHLRYQIAQSAEGKGWRYQEMGVQIVDLLQRREGAVYLRAKQAADNAAELMRGQGQGATDCEVQQAWVLLSRLFLAALRRRFMQRANEMEVGAGQ